MHITCGRTAATITRDQLLAAIAPFGGVTLDIGAGDGAWAYRYAAAHPSRFVIALDPVRENLREWSAKAAKKPGKGGLPNALFAVASVEAPPEELRSIADEIFVTLPWGSLMRGLIVGEETILAGIASFARDDASNTSSQPHRDIFIQQIPHAPCQCDDAIFDKNADAMGWGAGGATDFNETTRFLPGHLIATILEKVGTTALANTVGKERVDGLFT